MDTDGKQEATTSGSTSFGRFFNLSPDLLCVLNLEGYFIELNPAWEELSSISPAELKANPFFEFVHPEDRERTRVAIREIIKGTEIKTFTNRFVHRDESISWLSWTAALAVDQSRIYAIAHNITDRLQREESLRRALAQRRELLARLLSVREEERTQLARVVHDEMGQVLTGLKMDLAWLQNHLDLEQEPLLAKTEEMSRLIDTTIQAVRQISIELRPPILDDLGLVAAIEWQLQDLQKRTSLHCELITTLEDTTLDVDGRTAIFRIFQEILTNVSRHAQASVVKVSLEESDQYLVLSVHDNGRGITQDQIHSAESIGLLGMSERSWLRGGEIHIRGSAGDGTTVTVRLPLDYEPSIGHDHAADWEETP